MYLRFEKPVTSLSPLFAIAHAGFAPAHIGSLGRMNASYKSIAMALSFLLSVGQAGVVLGHSAGGSVGKKKSATDVYSVTCSNEEGGDTPTFRLAAHVRDELPRRNKPKVSVTIAKDGTAVRVTDKNGDGNRRYSPWAYVDGGNGNYRMTVTKSRRGAELYSVEFHCHGPSSSGYIHTGTDVVITQNQ
ncbi:MAG: hypothetical protein M3495_21670 [Pseudomonadota bacterium]|nr:hypothetical protein [Gammaproteobacteria bacterium]MDQ3584037.1 hypothetical protein [Pseudomonadota bacterium]